MKTNYILAYKENHNDTRRNLLIFDNEISARKTADHMIEQFKFWGGGSIPLDISYQKWTSGGKYAGGDTLKEFNTTDLLKYARENGNLYGYYTYMKKNKINAI